MTHGLCSLQHTWEAGRTYIGVYDFTVLSNQGWQDQ